MMIDIHLELVRDDYKKRDYSSYTTQLEKLSKEGFDQIKALCEERGWVVYSWTWKEQPPCDEGYAAAKKGDDINMNPYAEHFWKHGEWKMGWRAFHETTT